MNDQIVVEPVEMEYPLASFIDKYGKTAGAFLDHVKHLKRTYYPEYIILRHATFLSRYIAISRETIHRFNLKISPLQGSTLSYVGSNAHSETLWEDSSVSNKGVYSVKEDVAGSLSLRHTSFTGHDTFNVWRHCMGLLESAYTPIWKYAIEIIVMTNRTYERHLKSGFRTNGWGIVAVDTEDRYQDIYNFLKDNYGAPTIHNGWYQESFTIGNVNIRYILVQLLYSELSPDSITDIAFKLHQRFGEG